MTASPDRIPIYDAALFGAIDLVRLRLRLGWSQDAMGADLGLDRSVVSRMERGETKRVAELVRRRLWRLHHELELGIREDVTAATAAGEAGR